MVDSVVESVRNGSLYSDMSRACCGKGSWRNTCKKINIAMCYRQHITEEGEEVESEGRAVGRCSTKSVEINKIITHSSIFLFH